MALERLVFYSSLPCGRAKQIVPALFSKILWDACDDIFQIISFRRGKFFYSFWWGVSLSYVPQKWDADCKFHRTLKSAQLDLFETSDGLVKDPYSAEIFQFTASFLHGEQCYYDELVRAWNNSEPIIRNWLTALTTLEEILKMTKFQIARIRKGFPQHFPSPKLVHAFTLAKMGWLEEGLFALEELMKSDSQFYSSEALPKALRQIAKFE